MSANASKRLETALRDLSAALTSTGASWMIIGGIAVIARGVRRFTSDIDVAIRGDEIELARLVAALEKKRIVPRIAGAEQFASESMVLLLRHEPSGVDFDVSLAWTSFEHEAIEAATTAEFGAVSAPMARPDDLVVFKAIAGRGRDTDDMLALLTLYPKLDLVRIRARVRDLAALADAPDSIKSLERAITSAQGIRARSSRAVPTKARTAKTTKTTKTKTKK